MEQLTSINLWILIAASLVLIGVFSSLVATRFGAPLLLIFLVVGMLAGEDGPGGIVFNDYETTYLVGSLALSVILFDGGLRTRLTAFRGVLTPSLLLSTLGVVVTAGLTAACVYVLLGLTLLQSLLLGAIVASTDAAAVFFLLRAGGLRLPGKISSTLEIESGTNDPMAMFLVIVLTDLLLAGTATSDWELAAQLVRQAIIGAGLGLGGGFLAVRLLNQADMAGGLHPLFVVAGAIFIYAGTSSIGGSGLLAVYLAGLVMANRPVRAYPSIVGFHDAATWLAQIVMFLVLGLLVTPTTLLTHALPGLAVALFLMLVARPVAVWLCLWPFAFSRKEKLFVSWVGLRGAVSIFLAAIPTVARVPHSEVFFNIAFFVVLISLLVQGWSLNGVARRLGLALKRTAPSGLRIEIDIPGQVGQEIVGYAVSPDSVVLGISRLPAWARILLVVRQNAILDPHEAGPLQPGDYVYFLVATDRLPRLDRMFAESPDVSRRLAPQFGELPLNGAARLGDIADFYDIELAGEDRAGTVADFFARHLRVPPQRGHRLPFGDAMMIVREVEDGAVTRASLQPESLVEALLASTGRLRSGLRAAPQWQQRLLARAGRTRAGRAAIERTARLRALIARLLADRT